jgi:hypothetical protein
MGTISGCRHLKVNMKGNIYIYVYSSTQRCPNTVIKNFLIEDFFLLPPVSTTPVVHLKLHLREFSKKFKTALMEYSGAWGNCHVKKTRSSKSRDTVPLKMHIN